MLADVLASIPNLPPSEAVSADTLALLTRHKVPSGIVDELSACTFSRFIRIGALNLYPFSQLPKQNDKPNHHALRNGFLIIGAGPTGDPIAVELANGEVAILSHEILWTFDPECTRFDECVARSTLDLTRFWTLAGKGDGFPRDFYEAGGATGRSARRAKRPR